ncbi:MAG: cation:dicarboxylase symporter family transporter, partial [Bacteroidaceae bacterium]|nr:cation:dicarboxylase symporter family transporter [Bacteroidaceae bacterium]
PRLDMHTLGISGSIVTQTSSFSLRDFILDTFPSDIVSPIANGNMMQILFMAVFGGVALRMVANKIEGMMQTIDLLSQIVMKMVVLCMKVMPVVAFSSMASLFSALGIKSFTTIGLPLCNIPVEMVVLITCYCLLIWIRGGVSPIPFLRALPQIGTTPFTTCSSAASLPNTMRVCIERLGVDRKVASFTLPIGCTMNMDGCAYSVILWATCLCYMVGVPITPDLLVSGGIMSFLMSISCPALPNAGLVIVASVCVTMGAPIEIVSIVAGVLPIQELFDTTINVVSDTALATTISSSEKLLDKEKYYA